ncbi:MAG: hypothetical protein H3C60_11150 [Sphingomonadaceae bacterium]|nr:hypothetical protein [Sphingomonadaceae bacterium]
MRRSLASFVVVASALGLQAESAQAQQDCRMVGKSTEERKAIAAACGTTAPGAKSPAQPGPRSRREYIQQQQQASAASATEVAPVDYLLALDALGIRPGMTLRQAQAEAVKRGATLRAADHSNLAATARPAPENPYNAQDVGRAFTYNAEAGAGYRGHTRTLNPDGSNGRALPGITVVSVFPVEPLGGHYDPDNLIVYDVATRVQFVGPAGQKGVMSEAQFLADGGKRIGRTLHTARTGNRPACGFAVQDYVVRVVAMAGALQPKPQPHLAAWKQCGSFTMVELSLNGDRVYGYGVHHADAGLAERAFNAFRTYGAQERNAILAR